MLVTVKEWLKSVLNYRSYPKNKLGIRLFWTTLYIFISISRLASSKWNREAPSFHKLQQFINWLQKLQLEI